MKRFLSLVLALTLAFACAPARASAAAAPAWEDAYYDYFFGDLLSRENHPEANGRYFNDRYGAGYAFDLSGDDHPVWFILHDVDGNGVPELIACDGSEGGDGQVHLYTVDSEGMKYLGSAWYSGDDGRIYAYCDSFPGLFVSRVLEEGAPVSTMYVTEMSGTLHTEPVYRLENAGEEPWRTPDALLRALDAMIDPEDLKLFDMPTEMRDVFGDYIEGKIDDIRLWDRYGFVLNPDQYELIGDIDSKLKAIRRIGEVSKFLKGLGDAVKIAGGAVDIYNQIMLMEAMNPEIGEVICDLYMYSEDDIDGDGAYCTAGRRLQRIVRTDGNPREQVLLITTGEIEDVGMDMLLDEIKLAKPPFFAAAYAVTDVATGVASYAKAMNKLQWACELLEFAETGMNRALAAYLKNDTDENFTKLLYLYTFYLDVCASVEEAYAGVCKWQQETPIARTPDFVIAQKGESEEKGKALRSLAGNIRTAGYEFRNYPYEFEVQDSVEYCILLQQELK